MQLPDDAPYDGTPQPNANCNQIFQGVDIRISDGNPGAIGIRARGAQMLVVQDVTVFAGDGLVGLSGGSGSGGSHYGVSVVGGKYGVDFTTAQVRACASPVSAPHLPVSAPHPPVSAQPGPVATGFTLVNQTCSALVYAGLQTLTAVGLRIKALVPMAQPAIITGCDPKANAVPTFGGKYFRPGCELVQFVNPGIVQPCSVWAYIGRHGTDSTSGALSLVDSTIELGPASGQATAIAASASLYANNLWIGGAKTVVSFRDGGALPSPSSAWAEIAEYAHGVSQQAVDPEEGTLHFSSGVRVMAAGDLAPLGGNGNATELVVGVRSASAAPSDDIATRHLYNSVAAASLPSFESSNAVFAADCGARPDGVFDNAKVLTACVAAAAKKSSAGVVVLGRGIYRLSETLVLLPGVSLVGAGLHLTSLVPTSSGFRINSERTAAGAGTPVLRTTGGATLVMGMSITPWAHYATVSAVEWGADEDGTDSIWMQNHVNRLTECGRSGGSPFEEQGLLGAGAIPPCKMHVTMDVPLVLVTGAGSFYNFCE